MCTTSTGGHKHRTGQTSSQLVFYAQVSNWLLYFKMVGHFFLLNFLLINKNISFQHCTCLFSVLYPKKPLTNSLSFIIFYNMIKNSQSELFSRKMSYVACPEKYVMHNRYEDGGMCKGSVAPPTFLQKTLPTLTAKI